MVRFETIFPEFIQNCARFFQASAPYSLAILVLAFAFEFWRGTVEIAALFRFLMKIFIIILLIAQSHELINSGQLMVDHLIDRTGLVRPEAVAQGFKDRLADAYGDATVKDASAWDLVVSGRVFDAILYSATIIISYICIGLVTFVTFVQKFALFTCWACCPALFALIAIPPVAHLGNAHLMRIMAIVCWPIGFAVASTFNSGLLEMAINDRLMAGDSIGRNLGAAALSLLAIMIVAIWSVISSMAAPAFIQRILVGSAGSAGVNSIVGSLLANAVLPSVVSAVSGTISMAAAQWQRHQDDRRSMFDSPFPIQPIVPPPTQSPVSPAHSANNNDPTGQHRLRDLLDEN
jgi:type IV secretion system protein TrbL